MKTLHITAAAIIFAGFIMAAPVVAQQTGPVPGNPPAERSGRGYGWGPGMMMGPGMMGWDGDGSAGMCNPRAAGLAEWRMERIERLVKPTEAQRPALDGLHTASTKAAELISAACPHDFPASAPARLEAMEKRMDTMLQAIKIVRPAFDAFYVTLTEDQKARLNTAGPRGWGWHGWRG
jgi:hypothetical protein